MTCREARASLARSVYRVLFSHADELAIRTDEQGQVRHSDDQAIMHQALNTFLEKLRVKGEEA